MSRHSLLKNHLGWIFLWFGLVFSALMSRPPIPVDETRYLSVAWEMWQNNLFLVPHINGVPYSHKPPLFFWLIHLGWYFFGVNEWTARLTAPLFGFLSMFLTIRLAKTLWPREREIEQNVPYMLMGMLTWSIYSTLTMFDMLIVFFSLIAYLAIIHSLHRQKIIFWSLLSFATGLGLLAKGPVIFIFIGPPIILAPWWTQVAPSSWFRWYGGSIAALIFGILLALCWAVPAAISGGPEYSHAIFLSQTTERLVRSFAHQRPFYWYIIFIPILFFPWILWGPLWRRARNFLLSNPIRFCISATVPAFVLLSCISGKQIHYLIPLFPLVAILTTRIAVNVKNVYSVDRWPVASVLMIMTVLLLIIPRLSLKGGDAVMLQFIPTWIGMGPFLAGLYIITSHNNNPVNTIKRYSVTMVLLIIFMQLYTMKPMHNLYDTTTVIEKVRKAQEKGLAVAAFPERKFIDQFQFSGRLTRPLIPKQSLYDLVLWASENPGQYCLFFVENENGKLLQGNGILHQYKEGWLIFRSANNLFQDFQKL